MTLLPDDYPPADIRAAIARAQNQLDAARPAIPTPYFVGVGFDGKPVSWGQSAHYAETCAACAVVEVLPASDGAVKSYLAGGKVNIINNRAYAPDEVTA